MTRVERRRNYFHDSWSSLAISVLWCLTMCVQCSNAVTQAEVDLVAEFFIATKFANETPCTLTTICNTWPALIVCNTVGVTAMNFTDQSLTGTLPASLSMMPFLASFMAQSNSLSGTLPPEYSAWGTRLVSFYVGGNQLNGTLPSEYAAWRSLIGFSTIANNLTGTLPGCGSRFHQEH
ncbi:GP46-like surface antigen, putative [Bodo saltans]|uniref:GP46-like surface antigen, putative n=1 Tax=Bodo saltans TaxID=75058 RepID=A0A0S4ISG8_BODSA|nr:GP46-like surface antigen, putative [Bodo saltans]|eukprot:CUF63930.1 GP46-like surface antigen, putative [Bodo saltans]